MQSKTSDRKSERIEKVVELVRQRLDKEQAETVERFVLAYYEGMATADIDSASVENLYGAAYSLWRFGEQRAPGTPKIRAYNARVEEHGWKSSHTIVEVINDDMPFLVDSVSAQFTTLEIAVHLIAHPVVHLRRDGEGTRREILEAGGAETGVLAESYMHLEVSERSDPEALDAIVESLTKVLTDVRVVVEDWRPMLGRLAEATEALDHSPADFDAEDVTEIKSFLEWLADDHFTLLGYREYDYRGEGGKDEIKIVPDSGLGILRDPDAHVLRDIKGLATSSPEVLQFLRKPELIITTKANVRATVHRPVYMDYIGVKRFGDDGAVVGERRFIGLFTSAAYNQTPSDIPFLRRKVVKTLDRAGLAPGSHDGKALVNILETYPRDELFQISDDELFEFSMGILHLQERPRIRLFVRRDKFGRFASCLVFVPREQYNTDLRVRFERILAAAFNGRISAYYTQIGDSVLARLHFIVGTVPGEGLDPNPDQLEGQLVEGARSWQDDLYDALIERCGEETGNRLWNDYGGAFPVSYRETFNDQMAVFDIEKFERLDQTDDLAMNLYRPIEEPEDAVRLKIFHLTTTVALSDCLPMLERMGFKVISENPYRVSRERDGQVVWIHDFRMLDSRGAAIDLGEIKDKFETAFAKVWAGEIDSDGFNELVLRAGLGWREVVVIRAYCKYLLQVGIAFSQDYMERTLVGNPAIARLLVELFHARFDPEREQDREARAAGLEQAILDALDDVEVLDEDRILRRFLNLVQSTVRTNFYQRDAEGAIKSYVSFKYDSAQVAELPLPRPVAEISVYSPRVEGVHLRGGKVARGGLRWSDRREDYRTEVLGLMKAQMVKNAVIVPVGAKGGFYPRRLPTEGGRDAIQEEGIACYKIFVNGLLDITDNLVDGEVVPPRDVVRHDGDDPYLVVAADKGTATFSDIANGLAIDRGFWLGDAFASGGSSGYDHKDMGITARGAWESVKRHFRELGTDIQSEDFTVAGIGDMSGDVFGNGMLLSKHIKLVAAFDHRDIFIDPDPDPAASWVERQRLFELPRSTWKDYDAKLISEGGGVYSRKAKSIEVSDRARKLLRLERESYTPAELINALLKAPVDLLWVGGIGTYVKASDESHAEVGDRANDALRVNGSELRCRVVGEGGNLGFTQLGRIEHARGGGRLNTDAIDNSGGVDCSDHEVNIKVLLAAVVAQGEMTGKQRDRLLEEMTEEVAELVLRDNYLQPQAITVAQALGPELLESQARFMRALEREGRLDRAVEDLPDDETLEEYRAAPDFKGLTRPELSVLLAYAKMTLFEDLTASDVPEDPYLATDLVRYFPEPLRKKFGAALNDHRLRREIIATYVANSMVNRVGITFVHDVMEETGMAVTDVARAYAVTRDAFDLRQVWGDIEALDNKVPAALQSEMILVVRDLAQHSTEWFMRNLDRPIDIAETANSFRPGIAVLEENIEELFGELDAKAAGKKRDRLAKQGVPEKLARRVALLEPMAAACDIVLSAAQCERPVEEVARVYFDMGARLGLDWLRASAESIAVEDHWQRLAVTAIVEDLFGQQRALTNVVLSAADGAGGEAAIKAWAESNKAAVERTNDLIDEFKAAGELDIARLAIANRHVRSMIVGG